MRTKTFASLLILCGSTAALAQVTTSPSGQLQNNTTANSTANTTTPDTGTAPTAGDTTTNETTGNTPEPM